MTSTSAHGYNLRSSGPPFMVSTTSVASGSPVVADWEATSKSSSSNNICDAIAGRSTKDGLDVLYCDNNSTRSGWICVNMLGLENKSVKKWKNGIIPDHLKPGVKIQVEIFKKNMGFCELKIVK